MESARLISKILLFIDGSEGCIYAAKFGIALAKVTGAELKALYVVNTNLLRQLEKARIFVKVEEIDFGRDLEEDGRRYLRHITELAQRKELSIETELLKGNVHELVIQEIRNWKADLLVIGELEPVLSKQDTFHDEAEIIFRKAHCSVLVIKDPARVDQIYEELS
jgi:nucleotide-binding universal stress UspA family protein